MLRNHSITELVYTRILAKHYQHNFGSVAVVTSINKYLFQACFVSTSQPFLVCTFPYLGANEGAIESCGTFRLFSTTDLEICKIRIFGDDIDFLRFRAAINFACSYRIFVKCLGKVSLFGCNLITSVYWKTKSC